MNDLVRHRRRYPVGYGYAVEFTWTGNELNCEWDPGEPYISGKGARERFAKAYVRARNDFLQDVARLIGANVLAVDVDDDSVLAMTQIEPRPVN